MTRLKPHKNASKGSKWRWRAARLSWITGVKKQSSLAALSHLGQEGNAGSSEGLSVGSSTGVLFRKELVFLMGLLQQRGPGLATTGKEPGEFAQTGEVLLGCSHQEGSGHCDLTGAFHSKSCPTRGRSSSWGQRRHDVCGMDGCFPEIKVLQMAAGLGPSSFELCCPHALLRCTERCPPVGHHPGLPKLLGLRNAAAVSSPLPREALDTASVHECRWRGTREPAAVKHHEGKRQPGGAEVLVTSCDFSLPLFS